jgi:hypothetical protein
MALECSVYLAPKEPGLTYDELSEVGKREGFQGGEINDALHQFTIGHSAWQSNRILPNQYVTADWKFFVPSVQPDYRNLKAFDFLFSQLNERIRSEGGHNAQLDRSVMVERALAAQIPHRDIEAAITISILAELITEKDNTLRPAFAVVYEPLPTQQRQQFVVPQGQRDEAKERAYEFVKDVIARRNDGRPKHAEPLDEFPNVLERLGYGHFRLWWGQTVAELRRTDAHSAPLSSLVLSAALVEGALTFVVKHARNRGLAVFRSSDFDRDPRTWKIDELIGSAASGSNDAILDDAARGRAKRLVETRQRIHAGRMLSDFPAGVPDFKPDEARDGKATAELVVRRVIDWLEMHPPTP